EGLLDKTDGRASIIVTSQMDIDATLGNLEKQQEYDFSRIQGRFTTRISLTSANADEVIQRRLLEKKEEAEKMLCAVYDKQKNIIKSLFNFGEKSQFKTSYKSDAQFAITFPFIDYQFDLLQRAIIELSKNNAFSGKQQSVGERSLLTITQEVAKAYQTKDLNQIVQFCDMYEGIRGILQTKIQTDIQQAERTLNDEMALKVLKTLFLIKYVKGFPSTTDNLTKILLPTLDTDFPEFKSRIQEALNKLARTSYIEKGADEEYHYQTNEEKDIELEIKNEEIQPDAINNELKKIFRDEIFSDSKIKLSANKIFSYGRMVDEQQDGRDAEMYIHFITPLNELLSTDPKTMLMYSLQHPTQLCVVLGEDTFMTEDIAMFKKADKCLTRLLSGSGDNYRQQIVTDKRRVNANRRISIVNRLTELTKSSRIYMGGQELMVRTTELRSRLTEGMTNLVEQVYTNLKMLTIDYDDAMLKSVINSTVPSSGEFGYQMDNCTTEILNKISRNKSQSIRTKVKDLVDLFKGNNYGWYEVATLTILAKLYKMDKISFQSSGAPVADRDLYVAMTNTNQQSVLIVDIEETITNSQITKLKNLYKEFFNDESCAAQSAKEVHTAFIERLKREIAELRSIKDQFHFEFVKPLDGLLPQLTQLAGTVYPALYTKGKALEDALDGKVDEADVISQFVSNSQFEIFKRIDQLKRGNQANLSYLSAALRETIDSIYIAAAPWNKMTQAKEALDAIGAEIKEKQEQARTELIELIDSKMQSLTTFPAFATLPSNQQSQISAKFETYKSLAQEERYIGNLIAKKDEVTKEYNKSIEAINKWIEEEEERKHQEAEKKGGSNPPPPEKKVRKMVNKQKAMSVPFEKPLLETKEDVEAYVESLRKQLLKYIEQNNNIMLN
ncbi:MAG: BREX system P-loop protein BrxC, partial [Phocaeicola sp.]